MSRRDTVVATLAGLALCLVGTNPALAQATKEKQCMELSFTELSLKVVDERDRRRTLLGKLSSQTPRPRCHPGERYATYVEGYHYEVGSSGG